MSKRVLEPSVHAPDESNVQDDYIQHLTVDGRVHMSHDVFLGALVPLVAPIDALMLAFTCTFFYAEIPREACFPFKLRAPLVIKGPLVHMEEFTMRIPIPAFIRCAAEEYGYAKLRDEFAATEDETFRGDDMDSVFVNCLCGFQKNIKRQFEDAKWAYLERFRRMRDERDRLRWLGYLTARHPTALGLTDMQYLLMRRIEARALEPFDSGRLLGHLSLGQVDAFHTDMRYMDVYYGIDPRESALVVSNSNSLDSLGAAVRYHGNDAWEFLLTLIGVASIDFVRFLFRHWSLVSSIPIHISPEAFFVFVQRSLALPNSLERIENVFHTFVLLPEEDELVNYETKEACMNMLKDVLDWNCHEIFDWLVDKKVLHRVGVFVELRRLH